MHNLLIINLDTVEQGLNELTANSPLKVQQWFNKTLARHWLNIWAERGIGLGQPQKILIARDLPGANDLKWRTSYVKVTKALNKAPLLEPATINGTGSGSIAFSAFNESQLKALGNGAIPAAIAAFSCEGLIHIRDFLEYFLEQNPNKDLSKITPAMLPQMIADWDKQLRRVSELLQTVESIATLHLASNGYRLCVIGSVLATKHVGVALRNCLRNAPGSYFDKATLLCVKDPEDKIIAALELRMYRRVFAVEQSGSVNTLVVNALKLTQFYGPENNAPAKEAIDAFNEWVTREDIRDAGDATKLAVASLSEWGDMDADYEDRDDEDEEDPDEADDDGDEDEDEDEIEPVREGPNIVGRRKAARDDAQDF